MQSIRHNKVIAHASAYLHEGAIAITTVSVHALKWTMVNTIEMHKARWVVREFMEILGVHFNPSTTHVPATLESSLLVSIVLRHNLYFKQSDVKTTFLNSPSFGCASAVVLCIASVIHLPNYKNRRMA